MVDLVLQPPTVSAHEQARAFWLATLRAVTATPLPRWTPAPGHGVGSFEAALPVGIAAALQQRGLPWEAAWLAAHARVLGALSGESTVSFGHAISDGQPLPLCLELTPGRVLVQEAERRQAALRTHRRFPVEALRRTLERPVPRFETVFDPRGKAGPVSLIGSVVLHVGVVAGPPPRLRLHYRLDAFDAASAARLAGYHVAALSQLAADPDAEPAGQSLLSEAECQYQLQDLAGRRRELPEHRVHELFEQRVRAQPEAIAAEFGDQRWTYAQLNARANRLAAALLAQGLKAEDVVTVVTERHLDWMAAVLAVFKAGATYLPVEPHFSPQRVAAMLARAGCRLVLAEPGSQPLLGQALAELPAVRVLDLDTAAREAGSEADPGIPVAPDQRAYLYFTSGSTGEPKGAACEHAGMLNHLLAKIDDLGIDPGSVVAQAAPQGFDISLWQLLAAVLVGGRTLLLPQATLLDAERFVDALVAGRVNVVQLVPSYLEVVVALLAQRPRALPDLRQVSVTGEALKPELARRWFAVQPGIPLLNAYGLTETSDGTCHEPIDAAPAAGTRIALGRPIPNVHVDIVGPGLELLPLGAPGEIVFSGVCVGRGYVNDLERTRESFMLDPHRYGHWLFRSGDLGRWLPDGRLEFLGRRDSQIKIGGMRIEIGEVESALLRQPGVRDGAVVVAGSAEGDRRLVAFWRGEGPGDESQLLHGLRDALPGHIMPSACLWQESLPLTDNGKIDRKALAALAQVLSAANAVSAVGTTVLTPTELRLATAWAVVLGLPLRRVGRQDDFFGLGGTSLSALRLVVKLGRAVSLADIVAHPILADLAQALDERGGLRP